MNAGALTKLPGNKVRPLFPPLKLTDLFICSQLKLRKCHFLPIQGYGRQLFEFTFGLEFQEVMPKVAP